MMMHDASTHLEDLRVGINKDLLGGCRCCCRTAPGSARSELQCEHGVRDQAEGGAAAAQVGAPHVEVHHVVGKHGCREHTGLAERVTECTATAAAASRRL